ncbi:hypothetical protein B0H66DRAFT_274201 [Apodospora peruviana]|uniref:Uncharacterized protein n=1 Tax=Apodospora peruviana TaxID=516989 RepID=A0AAE0I0P5_9PEZI|nr:hypothetical protein B0H66DRAFT_274201 [Apodospora peruviana]
MRSSTLLLSVASFLLGGITLVQGACSAVSGVRMTFYGYPDNSPPGPATAYNCGGRNYVAGGTGTYANPLTFASAPGEYAQCEIIYSSYLKKYIRMEDSCGQCTTDWNSGIKHIDIWTGSATSNGGQSQINCENSLTPSQNQQVIRSPPTNLPVDSTALYSSGTCRTSNVYNGNTASCGGGSTCQTGCSWAGHCIGCPCTTYGDCSDNYICTNSKCANP